MPTLDGVTGQVYFKAWRVPPPRAAAIVLVHGEADPIVPVGDARDWSARVRRGRLAEFAGARHDVLN
jgi:alpha-beta hydrolase superfamily lysophospholipase